MEGDLLLQRVDVRSSDMIPRKMLTEINRHAVRRHISVSITMEDLEKQFLKQSGRCALSGEILTFGSHDHRTTWNASLDRIDSSRGYTKDNVQWVTKSINDMKGSLNEQDFINICKQVTKTHDT